MSAIYGFDYAQEGSLAGLPVLFPSEEFRSEWLAESPHRFAITEAQAQGFLAAERAKWAKWWNGLTPEQRRKHEELAECE